MTKHIDTERLLNKKVLKNYTETKNWISKKNKNEYLLSHSQQRLWLVDNLINEKHVYNVPIIIKLEGNLDFVALENSFIDIIKRHEILRTNFINKKGEITQYISPFKQFSVKEIDLTNCNESEADFLCEQIISEEATNVFDLKRDQLIRTKLIKKSNKEYILIIVLHHIITDGWSTQLLLAELEKYYNSYTLTGKNYIMPLKIQYGDYSEWQRDVLTTEKYKKQLSYWKKKLSDDVPVVRLPFKKTNKTVPTFNGGSVSLTIPGGLNRQIKDLYKQEGVTSFMVLLAVYKTLLFKYTGLEDLVVGSPVANRNNPEIEELIGFFVNTVVYRTRIHGHQTYKDVLKNVRSTFIEALDNQNIPFEKVVEEVSPEERGFSPLFNVAFSYQNNSNKKINFNNINAKRIGIKSNIAKYDLTLAILESSDKINLLFEFNSDMYSIEEINSLKNHFLNILTYVVRNPDAKLSNINMLSSKEEDRIIRGLNKTKSINNKVGCIHNLFEQQAEKHPNKIAISKGKEEITYLELDYQSNQLARYLIKKGVKKDNPVLIYSDRNISMIIGMLAVLKAGAAYIPVDPFYPAERIKSILRNSESQFVLSQDNLLNDLSGMEADIITLDTDWEKISKESVRKVKVEVNPDSLAYIIYTSGSTGAPKGVEVTHKGPVNLVNWTIRRFELTSKDRASQYFRSAFDGSVWEIWSTISVGATLYIVDEETKIDPKSLQDWLINNKITVSTLPPVIVKDLVSLEWSRNVHLRYIFTGSDRVQKADVDKVPFKIVNAYGPTEASVISSSAIIYDKNKSPHIGSPIDNAQIFILDADLNPVPIGVIGEIYISGDGIAKGYLNRPDLTAEKFIPNRFSRNPGARMYRTGDLGKYLEDGNIEFIGRIDTQIKIRGFRIELCEIESVICEYPNIEESIVLLKEDGNGNRYLASYALINSESYEKELKEFLRAKLPDYMIPIDYFWLKEWPLTPNGKIDRQQLLSLEKVKRNTPVNFDSILEEKIYKIWQTVLNKNDISYMDNFFESGGHSLLLTKMQGLLQEEFSVELSLKSLFENTTIDGMAKLVNGSKNQDKISMVKSGLKEYRGSYAQDRMYFMNKLLTEKHIYNVPIFLELIGKLNINELINAINKIIERHEILRTIFKDKDGVVLQVVEDSFDFKFDYYDLSQIPTNTISRRVNEIKMMEFNYQFDLSKGALFRGSLIKLAEKNYLIIFNFHHIIMDAWSFDIFFEELSKIYISNLENQILEINPRTIQYIDYSIWQRNWMQGEEYEKKMKYWKKVLNGPLPVLSLPIKRTRPAVQTYNGQKERIEISKNLSIKIKDYCVDNNITGFNFLLTISKILLNRYARQNDLIIGTPVANRNRKEIEGAIGLFVNTIAIRTKLSTDWSFSKLIEIVKSNLINAIENQDIPFEKIVEEIEPARTLSNSPIFQAMFSYNIYDKLERITLGNLEVEEKALNNSNTKFDIIFGVGEMPDYYDIVISYNSDLYDQQLIKRMGEDFKNIIVEAIQAPQKKISELSPFKNNDRSINNYQDRNVHGPIQGIIKEIAAKHPLKIAIQHEDESINYAELEERSNKLANYLIEQGVTTGDIVGVYHHRNIDMVIGLLAILKTGAAYVPIDPLSPIERLKYIVKDTGLKVIITDLQLSPLNVYKNVKVIGLNYEWQRIEGKSKDLINIPAKNNNLAYLIYTSGSTGLPKGVRVKEKSLLNLINWHINRFDIKSNDCITQIASVGFDAAVWEIWPTLCAGARLLIIKDELKLNPKELKQTLIKDRVTISFIPTPLVQPLLLEEWPNNINLRYMLTGGDRLLLNKSFNVPFKLINNYGPTECTVVTTSGAIKNDGSVPTIGKPITNVFCYVLNENMEQVPDGVVGELYVSGDSLAEGYQNNTELTAACFLPNPFSNIPGERLYKTGDFVRCLDNSELEYIGRRDNQVSINGYRIELFEIENVLVKHKNIIQVVVLPKENANGSKYLVAYITQNTDKIDYKGFLLDKLPSYMIPKSYIRLDSMPLNSNGKIDTKILKQFEPNSIKNNSMTSKNLTKTHYQLLSIWKRTLGVENIGINNNFFELGGDSMSSLQLISNAKKENIYFTIQDLFQNQTIDELSKVVKYNSPSQTFINNNESQYLTPIKKWFFDQRIHHNQFNMSYGFEICGQIRPEVFRDLLLEVVANHEELFTQIDYINNRNYSFRTVKPKDNLNFHIIDISDCEDKYLKIKNISNDKQSSLNIKDGPTIQAIYFKTGNIENDILVLIIHHLFIDAYSWNIILDDLQIAFEQIKNGKIISLPKESVTFSQWSNLLNRASEHENIEADVDYWISQTSNLKIPTDFYSIENTFRKSSTIVLEIPQEETKVLLQNLYNLYNINIRDLLVSSVVYAFYRVMNLEEMLINFEGHGRENLFNNDKLDLSRTVGWFTTIYPLLFNAKTEFKDNLKLTQNKLNSVPNNGITYGVLKYLSHREKIIETMSKINEPEILFNYLGQYELGSTNDKSYLRYLNMDLGKIVKGDGERAHLIEINSMVRNKKIITNWTFSTNHFNELTIRKLSSVYTDTIIKFAQEIISEKSSERG